MHLAPGALIGIYNLMKQSALFFHSIQRTYHPPLKRRLDNKPNMLASSHKDLGIILTSDLSWNEQYGHIAATAYKHLGLIK